MSARKIVLHILYSIGWWPQLGASLPNLKLLEQAAKYLVVLLSDQSVVANGEVDQQLAKLSFAQTVKLLIIELVKILKDNRVDGEAKQLKLLLELCRSQLRQSLLVGARASDFWLRGRNEFRVFQTVIFQNFVAAGEQIAR